MSRRKISWTNVLFLAFTHLAGLGGAAWYFLSRGPSASAFLLLGGMLALVGVSVTGGYHRLFAHGAYRAAAAVRLFYLLFGAAAFENSALKWAADHRRHHRDTDGPGDPYNIRRGFFWAHMGWIFWTSPEEEKIEGVEDLRRDPLVRWQHRWYLPIAAGMGLLVPAVLGAWAGDPWGGILIAGFLRIVLTHHSTFCVNSLAHTWGRRTYSLRSSARDSAITAFLTLGEGYHNFHHAFPFDYRNGPRWWQFDATKWWIRLLAAAGLARDLCAADEAAILRARIRTQYETLGQPPALEAVCERLSDLLDQMQARGRAWIRTTGARARAERQRWEREWRAAWAEWRAACARLRARTA